MGEILTDENIELFRQKVQQFYEIDKEIHDIQNTIKPLQNKIKQLKNDKKEFEEDICKVMANNDLSRAELPRDNGVIEFKERQVMVPITQKTVKEKMVLFFEEGPGSALSFNSKNTKEKGEEMYNYIYGKENRITLFKQGLKHLTSKN